MKARNTFFFLLSICTLLLSSSPLMAQQTGSIEGTILDKTSGESLPFVNVVLYQDGIMKKGTTSDFDGNYSIKEITPGIYEMRFQYIGYKPYVVKDVKIEPSASIKRNIDMEGSDMALSSVEVVTHKEPLIRESKKKEERISSDDLKKMGTRSVSDAITITPGTVSADDGAGSSTAYINGLKSTSRSKKASGYKGKSKRTKVHKFIPSPVPSKKSKTTPKFRGSADGVIADAEIIEESNEAEVKSGLTAGEIHDFSKWNLWTDLTDDQFKSFQSNWNMNPKDRYSVHVKNEQGFAVINAEVELRNGKGEVVWKAITDNTGKAELWNQFFSSDQNAEGLSILVKGATDEKEIKFANSFHNGINSVTLNESCQTLNEIDIAYVVDATGSMGDEISYLKQELNDVITKVQVKNPTLKLRTGSVFYRDKGDAYLTRKSDLTSTLATTTEFIKKQSANGGGDFPEAVDAGLDAAIKKLSWNKNAIARIVFLVMDAPPHQSSESIEKLHSTIAMAAKKGIRIIPVASSGIDKNCEFFLRTVALATNGTYSFLTDDSGIGNPHIKPSTDKYDVELLTDLMVRLITQYSTTSSCTNEEDESNKKLTNKENTEDVSVIVYPNPTTDAVFLKGLPKENKTILHLFDLTGKLLLRDEVAAEGNRLDLSFLANGFYLIRMKIKGKTVTRKVKVWH